MKKTFNTLVLSLVLSSLVGQSPTYLTNGNLRAQFGPGGATEPTSGAFLEFKDGDDWISLIYDVGLLIGGLDPGGNLKTFSSRGTTLTPGIVGIDAEITAPWRVTSDEVEAHLADFADNGVIDNPIPAIFSWPGRINAFSPAYNGFQALSSAQNRLASFWDTDSDSEYEPNNGDYPVLLVRQCDNPYGLVPTEMVFFPFTMSSNEGAATTLQVFMTAYRFGCEESASVISNSIFIHYEIKHLPEAGGFEPLENTFFGYWVDGDLGCFSDDYIGIDPSRFATYFYNASDTDGTCNPGGGFGESPPVVGVDLFRGPLNETGEEVPLTSLMPVFNVSSSPPPTPAVTDYSTSAELYNYLNGAWRDGSPLLNSGIGYESGSPTNFAFDGDPVQGAGWTEIGENNPLGDRRAIMSSGGFTMMPGAVNEYILGFTAHRDPSVENVAQVEGLMNGIDTLQALFDSCFDLESLGQMGGCTPLLTAVETPLTSFDNQLQLYPNPTQTEVTIKFPALEQGTLSVYTADGRLLLQKRTNSDMTTLDCSQWPSGLYLLRWEGEHQVLAQKLLVD